MDSVPDWFPFTTFVGDFLREAVRLNLAECIIYYSIFFTSVWLWLYALSMPLSRVLLRMNSGVGSSAPARLSKSFRDPRPSHRRSLLRRHRRLHGPRVPPRRTAGACDDRFIRPHPRTRARALRRRTILACPCLEARVALVALEFLQRGTSTPSDVDHDGRIRWSKRIPRRNECHGASCRLNADIHWT